MNVDTDDIPFVPFKASKPARVTTAKKAAEAEREARAEALDFAVVSRRVFDEAGEGRYFFRIVDAGVVFELDRVRRERHELWGELGVTCDLPGAKGIGPEMSLVIADFNLSSLQARQTRAKLLAERSRAGVIDWYGLMEDFCQRVIKAERSGNPAVQLRDLPRPEAGRVLNVDGWKLPSEHPTILFGDGGTLKSMLALYAAGTLANQGLRVMYVDWELEGSEHRDRLERLFGAEMPEIWYVRADRPLVSEVDRLRRSRVDHGIDYVVYDSIAFACDGPPESAEVASAYFRAVRKVGAGSLHIAHISRSETADQKPFGCYAADTEVLTLGGWKRHADVTLLDEVLAFDPKRHVYEWQRPTHLHQYDYNGEMVHISGASVDMLVTPNHRMVVKKPRSGGKFTGEWRFIEAGAFTGSTMRIPASAELDDAFSLDPSDAFIRFLGWWVAEGSLNDFGPVLTQVPGQLADRMKRAVFQLGYTAKVWVGKTDGRTNEQPCMQMRLRKATRLGRWLAREAGAGAHHKRLPRAVFGWSHSARELLLSSLMEGDGHWNSVSRGTYTTVSRQLADDVQQLALMTGWTARVRDERVRFCVLIGKRKALDIRVSRHVSRKPYGGKVFCLTLPAGAYVTRRNGHAGIAGNSSFWHNGARSTWFAQQAEQMPGQPVVVALLNRKSNLGALSPATAFGFRFTPDRTEVVLADVTTVSEVSAKLPLWQRMKGALTTSGPMTYPDLAAEVNAKLNTIIQTVNRSEGRLFVRMTGSDGVVRVGLAAR